MEDGILGSHVLDYGSGKGGDAGRLSDAGHQVSAYDPHFSNDAPHESDTVLLTYVVNVIEDPAERQRVVERAWLLTRDVLVVSARLTWDRKRVVGRALTDGVFTSRKTFQHLFSNQELRDLVQRSTGVRVVSASPGVVYAFRNDTRRLALLASQANPQSSWLESSDAASALAALSDFLEERGRNPVSAEVPDGVAEFLDHLEASQLRRATYRAADPHRVADAQKRSTLNTLLFLGMEAFTGRGPLRNLPLSTQADIRAFFSSYREAVRRSDRLLLKLRDDQYVRGAMRNSPGKLTPTALYVHRRAAVHMPVVLRLYEHCAAIASGRPPNWNIVKLSHQGRHVSWLNYPEFDEDPHPVLATSYSVDLRSLKARWRDYSGHGNPPLLHRKQEFVTKDDPDFAKYERLTRAEVRAGLYLHPEKIGNEAGWQSELSRCGRKLRGHRLIKAS